MYRGSYMPITYLQTGRYHYLYMHICITDIDECADGTNGCNHNCSNTEGSYQCYCFNGFELHDNMKNCIGTYVFCVVATLIVY